jgi:DNA-binding transcriptional LysR family regulator
VRFASSDLEVRRSAAERGLGIALLPQSPIRQSLQQGSLQPVLETQVGLKSPCSLVFVDREFMPAQLRVFIDRAVAHLQDLGQRLGADDSTRPALR